MRKKRAANALLAAVLLSYGRISSIMAAFFHPVVTFS